MKKLFTFLILFALLLPLLSGSALFAASGEPDEEEVAATGLPIVSIDLYNGATITDRETWKTGSMQIQNTDEYADCENIFTQKGGLAEIKGRGNSTWSQFQTRKRAYSLRLEEKTSLFGMEKSKRWILLANYMDRSNLRNKFAFDLSGRLGLEYCDSVFVNFYLNGKYQGVYQLCQRPAAPIDEWEDLGETLAEAIIYREKLSNKEAKELRLAVEEDLSWMTEEVYHGYTVADYIDLSERCLYGNYFIEYDYYYDEPSKFETRAGVPLNIRSPEMLSTNYKAMKSLKTHIDQFEQGILSDDFRNDRGYHYSAYVDMDSLVDYYIVNALIKNVEFGYKSMYLYTDAEGTIHLGPCWDYDWSSGNHFLGAAPNPEAWYDDWRASTNTWYHALYRDPYFVALVQERWFEVLPVIEDEIRRLDDWEKYLTPASDLEREVYLELSGEEDYRYYSEDYTFADEVEALRSFLITRTEWMTAQFSLEDPRIEEQSPDTDGDFGLRISDLYGELEYATDTDFPVTYITGGTDDLHITANESVTLLFNGRLLAEDVSEFTLFPADLRAGVNVLIARHQVGGHWEQDVLLFATPADEPIFVDIHGEAKEPTIVAPPTATPAPPSAPPSGSPYLWIGNALAGGALVIVAVCLCVWKVRRKVK